MFWNEKGCCKFYAKVHGLSTYQAFDHSEVEVEVERDFNGLYGGLLRVKGGFNALWVIMNQLTKLAHFILIRDNISTNQLGQIYIREIVKLHGLLRKIVSNRDT